MAGGRATITVTESVDVRRTPVEVFDYTQDYAHRSEWDPAITASQVLSESPRRIRLTVRGVGKLTIEYRLFRRGERTSAAFVDVDSAWFSGGGGSWSYEAIDGGTRWTQTNTLELKHPRLLGWLASLVDRSLRSSTVKSMRTARQRLEATG